MNSSYEYWENQFLEDMAIKYGFDNNHYLAFKEKLLNKNRTLTNSQLLTKIEEERGGSKIFPDNMIADSWSRKIYPTLEEQGFKEKRNIKNVRRWLRFEVFNEYIKNIRPETALELWQELWAKAEESSNISVQKHSSEANLPNWEIAVSGKWKPNQQKDCPSFPIGTQINYHVNLNNPGYLIVAKKCASGEISCLAPSNLSPKFPANWGRIILPKDDAFKVKLPIGYEEILAIFSQEQFQLDWLPQPQDCPLELQTEHLASLLNYVNRNKCDVMRYKFAKTHLAEADKSLGSAVSNPNFVGREDALERLNHLIRQQGAKVIVIQAAGGVGKTTLAEQYFQRQNFEVYLKLPMAKEKENIAAVESVIEGWLRQDFQEEPGREFWEMLRRLERLLQTRKVGVLIDNMEPALDKQGRFIEPHRLYIELLRVLTDLKVQSVTLITSRDRLCEDGVSVEHYLLSGLDEQAWEQFFSICNININTSTLKDIHKAYGGNAKAMELLCGAIQSDFQGDMVAYWQENKADLLVKTGLKNLIANQFNRVQELDPKAYKLLCRLGCYRYQDVPTVPKAGFSCLLWDEPEAKPGRIIESLRNRSLVECRNGEYWLHPVIQTEAIDRLKSEDWKTANLKAAGFWKESVKTVEKIDDAIKALEAYFHYINIDEFDLACQIITTGRKNRWIECTEGEYLGQSLYRLGLLKQATFAIDRIIGAKSINPSCLGLLYYIRGSVCILTGELNEAMEYFASAEKIAIQTECKELNINVLITMGFCQRYLWEIENSICFFQRVLLTIANDKDFNGDKFCAFSLLAFLYSSLDLQENKIQALDFAQQAEEEFSKTNLTHRTVMRKGSALIYLASAYKNLIYIDKKFYQKALKFYQDAKDYAEDAECHQIKAKALNGFAQLYREKENFEQAILTHHNAIEIMRDIGAKCDLAEACYQKGITYKKMGKFQKSRDYFTESIKLFNQMKASKQIQKVEQAMENGR